MLRLLHTADVHLGARHTDLGERASLQRERQFAAFRATVDLAISDGVDLFLIAGDLFDSNTQPRRTVERVATELGRLARASIRTVIIPGTHDVYDGASIYRAYDLAQMARAGSDWIAVLTPERPEIVLPSLDVVVYGRVFATKRAPRSPLEGLDAAAETRATWRVGIIHGALSIPGKTDGDEVVFTAEEIAGTGLDYLALGHWHSSVEGRAGTVTYAYPGSPEPIAVDQDGAGDVLLVTLDDRGTQRVSIEARRVGKTRCETLDLDVSAIESQPALVDALARHADSNTILEVRLTGLFPDHLDLDIDEVERELATSFLRLRIRDLSIPGLTAEPMPPTDTVIGAFIRTVEERIAALELADGNGSIAGLSTGTALTALPETSPIEPPAEGPSPATTEMVEPPEAAEALEATEAMSLTEPAVGTAEGAPETTEVTDSAESADAAEPLEAAEADWESQAAPVPVPATAPGSQPAPVAATAASEQKRLDELADLREVLRLGRHLLEGRHVTL